MDNLPDIKPESPIESSPKSEEDDELDPRVQIELERLNHANEAINNLELQLDDARTTLKEFCISSDLELFQLEKRIGTAVENARSYYDARIKLRDAKEILTKTKHRFERAQALHVAAKELAAVSADYIEEAKKSNVNDTTWNETYRHALVKAADAEQEKYQSDFDQQRAEKVYCEIEKLALKLQKDYRRSINKSKPYYEMKVEYYKELGFQKSKVSGLENCVIEAKSQYQESLRNLERISNEIHAQRNHGKVPKEHGERTTSDVVEEKSSPIESKPTPPSSPEVLKRTSQSDEVLPSSLLRTESLPLGVIGHTNDRYSPDGDETPTNLNDQFILCSKRTPSASFSLNSEPESKYMRERLPSFSSQVSQMTDDSDVKSETLHVLSNEQLDHLASVYHPYSSETDTIDELISQLQNSKLQAKTFFRNLFRTNSLKN